MIYVDAVIYIIDIKQKEDFIACFIVFSEVVDILFLFF